MTKMVLQLLLLYLHSFVSNDFYSTLCNYLEHSSLFFLSPQQEDCEKAYFKMDNVLIDDRRIHVDFSQSVAKIKWKGKGKHNGACVLKCSFILTVLHDPVSLFFRWEVH